MRPAFHAPSTSFHPLESNAAVCQPCRSSLVSRNITIDNHRTSVRLEPDMWTGLREICRREHVSLHDLCSAVATRKAANTSLTAAIRVFIMSYFRAAATEDGHSKAGHGPGGSFMSMHKHTTAPAPVTNSFQFLSGNATNGYLPR
ncbi:MAG: ribbon-helix-helix domain-containing protein [Alphaproteobacteria bacterium]|nr:ribbon-helix-helix domain-containing protein [Alphaproteobacteria bacterium]